MAERKGDRHTDSPISYRPPTRSDIRERLAAHADETGMTFGSIITAALDGYLPKRDTRPVAETSAPRVA
jgi:hypothetical protein